MLLDIDGNLIWKIPNIRPGLPCFVIAEDDASLAYINDWGFLYFIECDRGKILWTFDKLKEGEYFRTLTSTPNLELIGIGVFGAKERSDKTHFLNKEGIYLGVELETGSFSGIPLVKISSDGNELIYCRGNIIKSKQIKNTAR